MDTRAATYKEVKEALGEDFVPPPEQVGLKKELVSGNRVYLGGYNAAGYGVAVGAKDKKAKRPESKSTTATGTSATALNMTTFAPKKANLEDKKFV